GLDHGLGARIVEQPQLIVDQSGCFLHACQCVNELRVDRNRRSADREIFERPEGMDAVVCLRRNGTFSKQIVFQAVWGTQESVSRKRRLHQRMLPLTILTGRRTAGSPDKTPPIELQYCG